MYLYLLGINAIECKKVSSDGGTFLFLDPVTLFLGFDSVSLACGVTLIFLFLGLLTFSFRDVCTSRFGNVTFLFWVGLLSLGLNDVI